MCSLIYFTADLHFGHSNIIHMQHRPFVDVDAMNDALVANWNARVGDGDEVYILGDVTMKGVLQAEEFLWRLKGRKYLVRGNHDRFVDHAEFDRGLFEWIKDYHVLRTQSERFVLSHYPLAEWDQFFRGAYHLHGHQHNHPEYNEAMRAQGLRRYDVGVDANDYAPVSLDEIISYFQTKP